MIRFTEFPWPVISLASSLGVGIPQHAQKHAWLNLRLSGIRGKQASAAEGFCIYSAELSAQQRAETCKTLLLRDRFYRVANFEARSGNWHGHR